MRSSFRFLPALSFAAFLAIPKSVFAICPVCTVAVAGGVGLSRWLGIDDVITGIWIGGLTVSVSLWTIDWFNRKSINFPFKKILTFLVYYITVIASLNLSGMLWHPLNKLWNIDKLILGIVVGTIFFVIGNLSYIYLKKKNNGRAHFPFQKVVMPVASLVIISLIFYFIILK